MVRVVRHAAKSMPNARGPIPKSAAFMLPYYYATFDRRPMTEVSEVQKRSIEASNLLESDLHEMHISKLSVEDRVRFEYYGDLTCDAVSVDLNIEGPLQAGYSRMFADGPFCAAGMLTSMTFTVTASPIVGGSAVAVMTGDEVLDHLSKLLTGNSSYTLKVRFHEIVFISDGTETTFTYKG